MIVGTMVGGPGTVFGPLVGSLIFSLLTEILHLLPIGWGSEVSAILVRIVWGIVLIVVMLYMPSGVLGYRHERRKPRYE
jgi:branched-chain amino acid transport system permease protein